MMGIKFTTTDQNTREFLSRLGFSKERIASGTEIADAELRSKGINPSVVRELARSKDGAQDSNLDSKGAKNGLTVIRRLGGLQRFKKLTSARSCWASPTQLRFFLYKQVLNEGQEFPSSAREKMFAYGQQPSCRYDENMQPVMNGGFYPVDQMPALIRGQGAKATIGFQTKSSDGTSRGRGTGVIVSPQGHILTARHVIRTKSSHEDERRTGRIQTDKEKMAEGLYVRANDGRIIKVKPEHVIHVFLGHDLVLLHIPELAGQSYVPVASGDPKSGTPTYMLGYPEQIHSCEEQQRSEKIEREALVCEASCEEKYPEDGSDDNFYDRSDCRIGCDDERGHDPKNLGRSKKLFGSTGSIIPRPTGADVIGGDDFEPMGVYHTTAPVRPGISGGPMFIIRNGKLYVAGIVSGVDLIKGNEFSHRTNSSQGTSVGLFSEFIKRKMGAHPKQTK